MTAAEQLAEAIQRVIEEAVRAQGPSSASLKMAEAGKALGFHPSTVLRLCLSGELESTGEGRARRVPMSAVAAYQARNKNRVRRPLSNVRASPAS